MKTLRSELRKTKRITRSSKRKSHWRRFQSARLSFRRALKRSPAEFDMNKIRECGMDSQALCSLLNLLVGCRRLKKALPLETSIKPVEAFGEVSRLKFVYYERLSDADASRLSVFPVDPDASSLRVSEQLQSFPPVSSSDVTRLIL